MNGAIEGCLSKFSCYFRHHNLKTIGFFIQNDIVLLVKIGATTGGIV
jgi:hypothetical protein